MRHSFPSFSFVIGLLLAVFAAVSPAARPPTENDLWLLREAVEGARQAKGENHIDTLKFRRSLVTMLKELGQLAEAEKEGRALVETLRTAREPNDETILLARAE